MLVVKQYPKDTEKLILFSSVVFGFEPERPSMYLYTHLPTKVRIRDWEIATGQRFWLPLESLQGNVIL